MQTRPCTDDEAAKSLSGRGLTLQEVETRREVNPALGLTRGPAALASHGTKRVLPARLHATEKKQKKNTHKGVLGWPSQDILFLRCGCTRINHLFIPPRPLAVPALVQYYCTTIGQYTTPSPDSRLYAMHHIILVITISCKAKAWVKGALQLPSKRYG